MKKILVTMLILFISVNLNAKVSKTESNQTIPQQTMALLQNYEKNCHKGSAKACFKLGMMYDRGQGVKKNYAKAVKLYTKGCDGKNARSCTYLGLMYGEAKGVNKDLPRAIELFKRGCNGGHYDGCMVYKALTKK